jgi:hypothetical protein
MLMTTSLSAPHHSPVREGQQGRGFVSVLLTVESSSVLDE